MPAHSPQFKVPQRQFAVAPHLGFVYHDVERQFIGLMPYSTSSTFVKYMFSRVIFESPIFSTYRAQDVGADDEIVAAPQVFPALEIFKEPAQKGAFRVIDDEAGTDLIGYAEKIEVFADPSVISLFHFFQECEIFLSAFLSAKAVP